MGEEDGKIVFYADRIDVRTRKGDNAIIVTFETGEYQKDVVAELLKLLGIEEVLKVTVELSHG